VGRIALSRSGGVSGKSGKDFGPGSGARGDIGGPGLEGVDKVAELAGGVVVVLDEEVVDVEDCVAE